MSLQQKLEVMTEMADAVGDHLVITYDPQGPEWNIRLGYRRHEGVPVQDPSLPEALDKALQGVIWFAEEQLRESQEQLSEARSLLASANAKIEEQA